MTRFEEVHGNSRETVARLFQMQAGRQRRLP